MIPIPNRQSLPILETKGTQQNDDTLLFHPGQPPKKPKETKRKTEKINKTLKVPRPLRRFATMPGPGDKPNTNLVVVFNALHGECPENDTFVLDSGARIMEFTLLPCSANYLNKVGVNIIYGMFRGAFEKILPSLSDDNIYEKIHELRMELTHYIISYAIREIYVKLNEDIYKYKKLLSNSEIEDFENEKIKLAQEIREMYILINYILRFPHLLIDINVFDSSTPVPNKVFNTTDEFRRSQGGVDGTISAFKAPDIFSESKKQSIPQKYTLKSLGLPENGEAIDLLPKIRDREYITIAGENGNNTYHTTSKQINKFLLDMGVTIYVKVDVSCNTNTTCRGKPITSFERLKAITDQKTESIHARSNIPDEARYVEHLKHLLESQPYYSNLIQLLATMDQDPMFTEILRPSKGGSQKIKNCKISKTTVKKRKGKKRRRTKRR